MPGLLAKFSLNIVVAHHYDALSLILWFGLINPYKYVSCTGTQKHFPLLKKTVLEEDI
jgi:hypothetical protein